MKTTEQKKTDLLVKIAGKFNPTITPYDRSEINPRALPLHRPFFSDQTITLKYRTVEESLSEIELICLGDSIHFGTIIAVLNQSQLSSHLLYQFTELHLTFSFYEKVDYL